VSGFKYYLVVIDDCSHYVWTFPLRLKSDIFSTLSNFFAYVSTQFGCTIKVVQCDNGREFDNSASRALFLAKGVSLRMSCPYTSPQNGKAEHMLCTANNFTRPCFFKPLCHPHVGLMPLPLLPTSSIAFPTKTLHMTTPFFALYGTLPSYHDLRTFGCTCYPHLTDTTPHKLALRSSLCAFLGYSPGHKGYRCVNLATNRVIVSRHVVFFDESTFPFARERPSPSSQELDFLTNGDPVQVYLPSTGSLGAPGLLSPASRASPPGPITPRPTTSPGTSPLGLCLLVQ
jgi:hypothetical protein